MDRKVLTLEEIVSLDRRPTLQEVLDLSLDDYTKYLYHLGVISCIPENLEKYTEHSDDIYTGFFDHIVRLHRSSNYPINEVCWLIDKCNVERIDEDLSRGLIESGQVEINGIKIFYRLFNSGNLVSYRINEDDETILSSPTAADVGYMRKFR